MLKNKLKKGITLVEAMAVIGIGAAVSAGALIMYQSAQKQKMLKDMTEVQSAMFMKLAKAFNRKNSPNGLDSKLAAKMGVFPKVVKDNNDLSLWEEPINVTNNCFNSGIAKPARCFSVEFEAVPGDICYEFANASLEGDWTGIDVGGQKANADDDEIASTLAAGCDEDGTTNITLFRDKVGVN